MHIYAGEDLVPDEEAKETKLRMLKASVGEAKDLRKKDMSMTSSMEEDEGKSNEIYNP